MLQRNIGLLESIGLLDFLDIALLLRAERGRETYRKERVLLV